MKQLSLSDIWYPEIRAIKKDRAAHTDLLSYFAKLPSDLRKHIQTFHRSVGPTLKCVDCPRGKRIFRSQSSGYGLCVDWRGESVWRVHSDDSSRLCFRCKNKYWCLYCNMPTEAQYDTTTGSWKVCGGCFWHYRDDVDSGKLKRLVPQHGNYM